MSGTNKPEKKFPESKELIYELNSQTGYYQCKSAPIGFTKLPLELKVEETRRPEKIKSKWIIRGRIINGKPSFFTGIIPVTTGNELFFGDHFHPTENKKNSFILFRFKNGNQELKINYFNHFKVYPNKRGEFVKSFLMHKREATNRPPSYEFKTSLQSNYNECSTTNIQTLPE